MVSKSEVKRVVIKSGMKTLTQHNEQVGTAGVACDKCGTGMNYDRHLQRRERELQRSSYPPPDRHDGEPVVCPKCGHRGRMQSRIY